MLIEHSQQNINFQLDSSIKRVGLKISGGTDSAITGWMLSMYVTQERPDITIVPITVDQEGKAFQVLFAKRIIEFFKERFGNIYAEHQTAFSPLPESENYVKTQVELIRRLRDAGEIQFHVAGRTLNPPEGAIPDSVLELWQPPAERIRNGEIRENYNSVRYLPLVNIDKKGVAELYDKFGLRSTLFPLTRSCEDFTDDFSHHCGKCWFCAERKWGFSTL